MNEEYMLLIVWKDETATDTDYPRPCEDFVVFLVRMDAINNKGLRIFDAMFSVQTTQNVEG